MGKFTDIFIHKPVLATVVSLLILVVGLRAALSLPVLQYPRTENAVVTVTTAYYGADPDVVAGFITTPLEAAVAKANGIDYITSTSTAGLSTITAHLRLNFDYNRAMTEISSNVNAVTNRLPPQSQQPAISVAVGEAIAAMYLEFHSPVLQPNQITDYLTRVVQPKIQAVQGVQNAEIMGARNFALRAWLDPAKLAAYGLTASDVNRALANNDYISGLGNTKGQMVQVNLTASTGLTSPDQFADLVVKEENGAIVRLGDIAVVSLGSEDYSGSVTYNGENAIVIAVNIAPDANLLDVSERMVTLFPQIQAELPEGLVGNVAYNAADFVNASIEEVVKTILEALAIVTLVVFAFLGSLRAMIIPVVTIPLSLVGAFIFMLALGFSINLLTLLAMVLAIGLVVDDAIIVVENVNRHMNEGTPPFAAAIRAARELATPIIAMTVVLVAVYIPIAFQGGLTGALFIEFAFTLVGAITISMIVALTLSPMMCARLLKRHGEMSGWQERVSTYIDRRFDRLHRAYESRLHSSLETVPVTAVFAALVFGGIYFLYTGSRTELAPSEDIGFVMAVGRGAPNATTQQYELYGNAMADKFRTYPELDGVFQFINPGQTFSGLALKPWGERDGTANDVVQRATEDVGAIPGLNTFVINPPPLPGAGFGPPVGFVIGTTEPFDQLYEVTERFLAEVRKEDRFMFIDADLKIDQPQAVVEIDRDKAALLGLTMSDIGGALSDMLGGGYVNYFSLDGRAYRVMSQADQPFRLNPDQLLNYYIRTPAGDLVALSTVAHIETKTIPQALPRFQQLNAATIQGVPAFGTALGDSLAYLQDVAARVLPDGYTIDYTGESRQFVNEASGFIVIIVFAAIIIYLALAALFESFRDPVIILVSVPMSIAGALIFIYLLGSFFVNGASLNIYTQVGLVTLMGLISKHGILIVEVANRLQAEGYSKREAVETAAGIRLRPILMTTAAMVLGVVPLLIAVGAGAAARFSMGLVISTGITIGTLFTLFVVPAAYMLLAQDHSRRRPVPGALPAPGLAE